MFVEENHLFNELEDCESILLAGAGGGFDIYSGIPLYLALRRRNKNVHLANLSFASLRDERSQHTECCFEITKDTTGSISYFPERTLCRWFDEREGADVSVFAFPQNGVVPLRDAYQYLIENLNLDAIVLVDGGTDSLMRGDEAGLGTPSEDVASMVAVNQVDVRKKLLSCIGFGVDRFHGVCHAHFLESVATLTEQGAFLGTFSVLPQTDEGRRFIDLVEYSSQQTTSRPSIVNTSIASAVQGKFGDYHATYRTEGSKLWISPLMTMYWTFRLESVVERNLYADRLLDTRNFNEVGDVIRKFRKRVVPRKWDAIPD